MNGMPVAALWPRLVRALVPLRQGLPFDPSEIDAAWTLVEQIDEPLRRLSALVALAEISWMTGVPDSRVIAADTVADDGGAGWASGSFAVWRRRLGLDTVVGSTVAEPHRLSLAGRHAEAAQWWQDAGDPFAAAMCLLDSDDPARAVVMLDTVGATGTADRARAVLRERGITDVPQRPRRATRGNPGGLTNRQLDVARLVAQGLSNTEIAGRLYISPKTADHHVSAVLAKLGMTSRRELMLRAGEFAL